MEVPIDLQMFVWYIKILELICQITSRPTRAWIIILIINLRNTEENRNNSYNLFQTMDWKVNLKLTQNDYALLRVIY